MLLTVDTSALIAVIVDEPQREMIVDLARGADLIAPASVRWEVGNALSALLKRHRLTMGHALEAIEVYERIPIRYTEVSLSGALQLVERFSIYAYDAYALQCAQRFRTPLLSLDNRLVQIAHTLGIPTPEMK